jgi:putative PIG3 family NAD(P)H quinone oxidoreductase
MAHGAMKYVEISASHSLQLAEGPAPQPGPNEVLIRVAAAGVNRADTMQRMGKYPPPPGASPILGMEVSGKIVSVGPATERWRVGDDVCALVAGGGYSELCVAPGPQCLPVPAGLSMVEAAALPETFYTVWTNVFQRGRLRAGETILIHGGSSGVGTTAIQLAREFGARSIVTAGSEEKCDACRKLGADLAINYRTQEFVSQVRGFEPDGVDVILDLVGAEYFARNLECLAMDGRLVQIATPRGNRVELDLNKMMQRRITITGSTLRSRTVEQKAAIARELESEVWPRVASGRVRPPVYRVFPLAEAMAAHELMESGEHIGKIVLAVF